MKNLSLWGSERPFVRPFALLVAVALAAAVMLSASPARAGLRPNDFYICPEVAVGAVGGVATQGSTIFVGVFFTVEEWSDRRSFFGESDPCVDFDLAWDQDRPPVITVTLPAEGGTSLDWRGADDTLVADTAFDGVGADGEDFSWTLSADGLEISTNESLSSYRTSSYTPGGGGGALVGADRWSAEFSLDLRSDAAPGDYTVEAEIELTATGGAKRTYTAETDLTIVAAEQPEAPAGAGPVVSCSEPQVGGTVTCDLTSDPSVEFLWEASTNPVFATGVVTTDATGAGRFSFTVPASALGESVLVAIVDWTAPTSIGVAAAPVPTSLPAGEGQRTLTGGELLLGVVLLAGVLAVRTSRRGAQVDAIG